MSREESARLAAILIKKSQALFSSSDLLTFWNHPVLRTLIVFLSADSDETIDIPDAQTMLIQMLWSRLWITEIISMSRSSAPLVFRLFIGFLLDVIPKTPDEGVSFKDSKTYNATRNAIVNVQNSHSIRPSYHWHMFTLWIYSFKAGKPLSVLPFILIHVHLHYDSDLGFWVRLHSLLESTCYHVQMWRRQPKCFQTFLLFLRDEVGAQPPPQLDPGISEPLITATVTLFKSMISVRDFERGYEPHSHVILILLLVASLPPALFRAVLSTLWEWHAQHRVRQSQWRLLDELFCGDWIPSTDNLHYIPRRDFRMSHLS
jgi:hypothetical protein